MKTVLRAVAYGYLYTKREHIHIESQWPKMKPSDEETGIYQEK